MEDMFRTQMESYKLDPSPGLWQKVHSKILWKQFLTFSFQTFNVYYLAAAISLAGIGIYAFLADQGTPAEEHSAPVRTEVSDGVSNKSTPEIPDIPGNSIGAGRKAGDAGGTESMDRKSTPENQPDPVIPSGNVEPTKQIDRKYPEKLIPAEKETVPGDQRSKCFG